MFRTNRYNIEVTIDCRTRQDAENLAASILYSGFIATVKDTMISIIAKNVDGMALEYLVSMVEDDDRVVGSSFHKTLF